MKNYLKKIGFPLLMGLSLCLPATLPAQEITGKQVEEEQRIFDQNIKHGETQVSIGRDRLILKNLPDLAVNNYIIAALKAKRTRLMSVDHSEKIGKCKPAWHITNNKEYRKGLENTFKEIQIRLAKLEEGIDMIKDKLPESARRAIDLIRSQRDITTLDQVEKAIEGGGDAVKAVSEKIGDIKPVTPPPVTPPPSVDSGPKLPPGYTKEADGTIRGPGGNALPRGSTLNSDGSISLPNGYTVKPDGTIVDANGNQLPTGSKVNSDGSITLPNGYKILADGTVVDPNGNPLPKGTKVLPDGTILLPNGWGIRPDGSIINPDGKVVPGASAGPGGVIKLVDGSSINPATGDLTTPDGKVVKSGAYSIDDSGKPKLAVQTGPINPSTLNMDSQAGLVFKDKNGNAMDIKTVRKKFGNADGSMKPMAIELTYSGGEGQNLTTEVLINAKFNRLDEKNIQIVEERGKRINWAFDIREVSKTKVGSGYKASYKLENSDDAQAPFVVEGWEVTGPDGQARKSTGESCDVEMTAAGQYTIKAIGKTKEFESGFVVTTRFTLQGQ